MYRPWRNSFAWLLGSTLLLAGCGPPRDEVLVQRFQSQRLVFEKLAAASCKLPLWQHIRSEGWSDPEMAEETKNWFLVKMSTVGVDDLVVQGDDPHCSIQMGVWSEGFAGTPASWLGFQFGSTGINLR